MCINRDTLGQVTGPGTPTSAGSLWPAEFDAALDYRNCIFNSGVLFVELPHRVFLHEGKGCSGFRGRTSKCETYIPVVEENHVYCKDILLGFWHPD